MIVRNGVVKPEGRSLTKDIAALGIVAAWAAFFVWLVGPVGVGIMCVGAAAVSVTVWAIVYLTTDHELEAREWREATETTGPLMDERRRGLHTEVR